jgi:hypothetical protein
MDLAGGTFAACHTPQRVVTVQLGAVEFLRPVMIGGDASVFCWLAEGGRRGGDRARARPAIGTVRAVLRGLVLHRMHFLSTS